jgi:hypothetical protein
MSNVNVSNVSVDSNVNVNSAEKAPRKTREMSPKWWLGLSMKTGNMSVDFLEKYRDMLVAQVPGARELFAAFDAGECMPTPTIIAMQKCVMALLRAEAEAPPAPRGRKPVEGARHEKALNTEALASLGGSAYIAKVLTQEGEVCVTIIDGKDIILERDFLFPQEAEKWLARRLYAEPGCTGVIVGYHKPEGGEMREDSRTFMSREAAIAMVDRAPGRKPASKRVGGGDGPRYVATSKVTFSAGLASANTMESSF